MAVDAQTAMANDQDTPANAQAMESLASESPALELIVMRHGQTPGNALRRYIGSTDDPLSEVGRQQAADARSFFDDDPEASARFADTVTVVFASPMQRALQTAALCFSNAEIVTVENLREMDFGAFENRSADDMSDDPDYIAWVEGWCVGECPGGEARDGYIARTVEAVESLLRQQLAASAGRLVIVAHGGTVMAVMSQLVSNDPDSYYNWGVSNCGGYRVEVRLCPADGKTLSFGQPRKFGLQ